MTVLDSRGPPRYPGSMVRCAVLGVVLAGLAGFAGLGACGGGQTAMHQPNSPDCVVTVLMTRPGADYVEVGEFSLEATAHDPMRPQYKNPHALAADIHDQICAAGGDTLVAERDTSGVIQRGWVYRHTDERDINPRAPLPRPMGEQCEPACNASQTCEGGTCVERCEPPCAIDPR